jgi:hypothetical protein
MPRPAAFRLSLALTAALFAVPALATSIVHLDTRGLVHESSEIVVGEIEGTRTYWNDSHTKILTDVEVRVSQQIKGAAQERLILTQLGGEIDGMRYTVPGCPIFRRGEEALLFVWRDSRGRAQVSGLAQGKFDIRRDPASGERLVQRALPGLSTRDARSLAATPAEASAPAITLSTMLREIQRAMAEDGR